MHELLLTLAVVLITLLVCYFLTKWERVVFPGNQQNGQGRKKERDQK
ncbi:hypothetical protein LOK74_13950 [Brevibacillus humidisoli]|nr:hypothetical protein [Brevibacillus humidisoli]UFJ39172.1 hypothetical protein LOK74_13950 [Brevibacillus humidisoli]